MVQSSQEVAGGRRLEDPARSRNNDGDDCHDDGDDDCHSDGDNDGVADDYKVALSTSCLMCSACLVLAHAHFGDRTVQS